MSTPTFVLPRRRGRIYGGNFKYVGNVQKVKHFNKPLKTTPIPSHSPPPSMGEGEGGGENARNFINNFSYFPLPLIPSHEGRGNFGGFLKWLVSLFGFQNIYASPFERY